MPRKRIIWPTLVALSFAVAAGVLAPRWLDTLARLSIQDDPVAIANRAVQARLSAERAEREIEEALKADDVELADSFVALAAERGIAIKPELTARVQAAHSATARTLRNARSFARGLIIGEPSDMVGFAGTAVGDFFVFGDVRDATREGIHYVRGQPVDEVVLGLSCVGIAITAGTYASLGAGAPARIGLTVVKTAMKTGRLGMRMTSWLARSLHGVVDVAAARRAVTQVSLAEPALAERALRDAVKLDRAQGLLDALRDVGRIEAKAGARTALDSLKVAEGPRDLSRLARLAAAKGGKTRAIIKLAGRAAIVLGFATFELASWALSAIVFVFGFLSAVRSMTERATLRYIGWRKTRSEPSQPMVLALAPA
jgi:hypothetical protein